METPTKTEVVAVSAPASIVLYENEIYILENTPKKVSKFDVTATTPTKTDVVTGLEDYPQGMAENDLFEISFMVKYQLSEEISSTYDINEEDDLVGISN